MGRTIRRALRARSLAKTHGHALFARAPQGASDDTAPGRYRYTFAVTTFTGDYGAVTSPGAIYMTSISLY